MDRRDALKVLVSLPSVSRIAVADLKPDDVLVVECDDYMSAQAVDNIKQALQQVWPGRKCVVLEKSLRLKVVSGDC